LRSDGKTEEGFIVPLYQLILPGGLLIGCSDGKVVDPVDLIVHDDILTHRRSDDPVSLRPKSFEERRELFSIYDYFFRLIVAHDAITSC
jgi:hypothetical protein